MTAKIDAHLRLSRCVPSFELLTLFIIAERNELKGYAKAVSEEVVDGENQILKGLRDARASPWPTHAKSSTFKANATPPKY